MSATGVRLMRSVTSPTAQMDGTDVRLNSSTAMAPAALSATPTLSRPSPRVFGLRPVANITCAPERDPFAPFPTRADSRAPARRPPARLVHVRQRRVAAVDGEREAAVRALVQPHRVALRVQHDALLRQLLRHEAPHLLVEPSQRQLLRIYISAGAHSSQGVGV